MIKRIIPLLLYKDGRLVKNLSDVEVKTDSDIMSGMLTAINDFVQDSFNTEGDLGSIDYGNNKIILQSVVENIAPLYDIIGIR